MYLLSIIQTVEDIEQKLQDAPDDRYGIGIVLGNLIPFTVLALIAYAIYYYNKKRMDNNPEEEQE